MKGGTMVSGDFLKRLGKLGFPLLETEEVCDVNATLAEVVKSKDLRFWEGFPVILANSGNRGLFDYDAVKTHLKESFDRDKLSPLVIMSLALYKVLDIKFSWADRLDRNLNKDGKKMFGRVVKNLKKNETFKFQGCLMSSQRLKQIFNNYFNQERLDLNDMLSVKEGLSLEYALSQVFSPKQKELFLKKFRREKLTKTEKEYFSRVVKKKVRALANSELYRLSRKLLEDR